MEYPHKTILLNGSRVSIQKIVDGSAAGDTPFEISTISFIKDWLTGKDKFYLKTSGSTGVPKKITATRKQLESSAQLTIRALGLKTGGKIFLCIDTHYIGGMMMLVRAFVNAMRIEGIDPSAMKNLDTLPANDLTALVPFQVQTLYKTNKSFSEFNKFKNILIGGAPLSDQDVSVLKKCKTNIFATYGMTETYSHIALKKISPTHETAFHILPTVKIKTDDRGCLVIRTPFLKKEITTNDIVEITGKGSFKWIGRYDHVINSGGVKVNPEHLEFEIQKIANSLAITNRFYITGEPDAKLGERVVLVMEGKKFDSVTEKIFRDTLSDTLPRYHAPKKIRYAEQFNVVNNKIKRE